MKTVSVELPEDLSLEVQDMLRKRLERAQADAFLLEAQIKKLAAAQPNKSISAVANQPVTPTFKGLEETGDRRQSKEAVKKLIVNRLRELNGQGVGMTDLRKSLGTAAATTYRALKDLQEENVVLNVEYRWKLKH